MIVILPIMKDACMILFSKPTCSIPSGTASGLSLKRIFITTFAPTASLKRQSFLATSAEEQVGLNRRLL